jgi:hypothetical protein
LENIWPLTLDATRTRVGLVDLAIEVIEGDVMPLANSDQQRSAIIHQDSAAAISHEVFPKQLQLGSSVNVAVIGPPSFGTLGS